MKKNGVVEDIKNLDTFFNSAFDRIKKEKKYLWTTKNMYNPFYKNLMTNEAEVGFYEFSGDLLGIINRKEMKIKITLEEGENEQLELLFMYQKKDGGIVRFSNVVVISTKLTKGGKTDERGSKEHRVKSLLTNNKKLLTAYPEYIKRIDEKGDEYRKRSKLILNKIEGGKITDTDIDFYDKKTEDILVDKIEQTPKIKKLQEHIVMLMEKAKIPRIEGARKDLKKTRGDLLGYDGWTFTMGIGRRRNLGVSEFSANSKEPELFKAVIEYGNAILPTGFKYSAITINRNLQAKKHKDGGNAGISGITFLGDYKGGGLYIYDENDKPTLYNTHNKVIMFNGKLLAHRTEDFTGNRYAFIFYNQQLGKTIKGIKMEGKGLIY